MKHATRAGLAGALVRAALPGAIVLGGLAALTLAPAAIGDDAMSGEAILRKADKDHRSTDERSVVQMVLVAANDERQRRVMEVLTKSGQGDDDLNVLRFLEPVNIRNEAVLTIEATGRADDQWLFIPALRKTKRIASSQRSQRFAGTDFTFEDLRTEDFPRNTYKTLADSQVDGSACYVVEATAKEADSSAYGKRQLHVDKARFLILKVEFFDKQGRHCKTLLNKGYEQVQGLWRPKEAMMEDLIRSTKTVMRFTERTINPGLPESTFTEAALERGA